MDTITKYELRRRIAETTLSRSLQGIRPGCTQDFSGTNCDSDLTKAYDDEASALRALANYNTDVSFFSGRAGHIARVEEYWVEKAVYAVDEDGDREWIDGGDIFAYSAMPDELEWDGDIYRWDEKWNAYIFVETGDSDEEV